jgi:hypothetical protein
MLSWQCVYTDNTVLNQYNEDGTENSYTDIDRSKLSEFRLFDEAGELKFSLVLDEGQRLIYRRRVFKTLNNGDDNSEVVVYLVGWQDTVNGKNVQAISYIREDWPVVMGGKFRENALMAPITPMPGEE